MPSSRRAAVPPGDDRAARFLPHPLQGKPVRSISSKRTGVLVAQLVSRTDLGGMVTQVFVRPVGGGYEWTTSPDDVEPAHPLDSAP
jgi:hypothetical protein